MTTSRSAWSLATIVRETSLSAPLRVNPDSSRAAALPVWSGSITACEGLTDEMFVTVCELVRVMVPTIGLGTDVSPSHPPALSCGVCPLAPVSMLHDYSG